MVSTLKKLILIISFICVLPIYAAQGYSYQIRVEQFNHVQLPCTATAISRYTFLTAAHCLEFLDLTNDIYIHVSDKRLAVESIYIPMEYYEASTLYGQSEGIEAMTAAHRQAARFDIAIINFKRLLPRSFRRVNLILNRTKEGSAVSITSGGIKRDLNLHNLDNEVYLVKGNNMDDPLTVSGDSGGPLFLRDTKSQIGVLRGSSATDTESASIYTPIYLHQRFIQRFSK